MIKSCSKRITRLITVATVLLITAPQLAAQTNVGGAFIPAVPGPLVSMPLGLASDPVASVADYPGICTPADVGPSLGDYTTAGTEVFDTDALTYGGTPGGVVSGGIAIFVFDSVTVPAGTTIQARGTLPLAIYSYGTIVVDGTVEANGDSAVDFFDPQVPTVPGAGGGAGGLANVNGDGSGGGTATNDVDGAGGGGFGGAGGDGGDSAFGGAGPYAGGLAYGDLNTVLEGGSGGGGANGTIAGASGGAILFSALGSGGIVIGATGTVEALGGSGSTAFNGGSAAGSGGGLLFNTVVLDNDGLVTVQGGEGGAGGCCGDGGDGGGGRILVAANFVEGAGSFATAGIGVSAPTAFTRGDPATPAGDGTFELIPESACFVEATPVPTLSRSSLTLLIMFLLVGGVYARRRFRV